MKIGIVTPTLNAERFIEQTLASIWRQRAGDLQLDHVIVDGGSEDATLRIAASYPSRILAPCDDGGMYDAINRGFREVAGDVVGYINADDELADGVFEIITQVFDQHPEIEWLFGALEYIDGTGQVLGRMRPVRFGRRAYVGLGWSCVPQPTSWVRRSFLERVGSFDASFRSVGDYEWFARALSLTTPYICPRTLARFRVHPNQLSQDSPVLAYENRRIQDRYGARNPVSYLAGRLLSLRLNLANPRWLVAKKTGRIRLGGWPPSAEEQDSVGRSPSAKTDGSRSRDSDSTTPISETKPGVGDVQSEGRFRPLHTGHNGRPHDGSNPTA